MAVQYAAIAACAGVCSTEWQRWMSARPPERVSLFSANVSKVRRELFPGRLLEQKAVLAPVLPEVVRLELTHSSAKGEVKKAVQIFDNLDHQKVSSSDWPVSR